MKVLKNNFNKINAIETKLAELYPRKFTCEMCNSELQYDKEDLRMGVYGYMHIECPLCGYDNMLDEHEDNIVLTRDTIEFPTHFHHVSKETGAKDVCNNEEVKKYLRQAIEYFRQNKDEYSWGGWITGNLYIHVHRYSGDEDYDVIISNDFYNTLIPFEPQDY